MNLGVISKLLNFSKHAQKHVIKAKCIRIIEVRKNATGMTSNMSIWPKRNCSPQNYLSTMLLLIEVATCDILLKKVEDRRKAVLL